MNIIKPASLKKNATIGFLAVSGQVTDFQKLEKARIYFENKGYTVKYSKNIHAGFNNMCGSDEMRLDALHSFFSDNTIDAILCVRGGYGAIRLLKNIDYNLIANNPKIFAGYSDITAFSLMFYKRANLLTFSSPMACSDFYDIDLYSESSFFKALSYQQNSLIFSDESKVYVEGSAQGRLWGGNLATVASLCGLDFVPDEKFIFCIEDISEPVYKIDRMISQLMNIDNFKNNLAGIVLGDFGEVDDLGYFESLFTSFDVPVKSGLAFGHTKEKLTLPIGAFCEFSTKNDDVRLIF